VVLGVSLKLYLSAAETLRWCEEVVRRTSAHPGVASGQVEVFVLPSFPVLAPVARVLDGGPVRLGAQDLFWEDRGAYTGEVSGGDLAELGCSYVEIGHAERRRLFHQDDGRLAAKVRAARRNDLTPALCVGERDAGEPARAAAEVLTQLAGMLPEENGDRAAAAPVLVAYEPEWAIGADRAASPEHVRTVTRAVRAWLAERPSLAGSRVLYGGSAGPGTLTELSGSVDGLFLGRFAHEPDALLSVVDEAHASLRGPK
jgi:triosephosphate isomerase